MAFVIGSICVTREDMQVVEELSHVSEAVCRCNAGEI